MKINNKQVLTILFVAVVVLIAFYVYSVKGIITQGEVSGAMVLKDQKLTYADYEFLRDETFSNEIYLPSDSCEGVVNYCHYVYKSGVNASADINQDGKIDVTDGFILAESFGCKSGDTTDCWNQPVDVCFFVIGGRKFKDPTRDCKFNQSDMNLITASFGLKNSYMNKPGCESDDICKSDINQDGIVNAIDAVIAGIEFNKSADTFERLVDTKSKADINKDGFVNAIDAVLYGVNYGKEAIEQKCSSVPLAHIGGRKYSVSATGRGLYYTGVSYWCQML
jgi:hypothetical protein